MSVRKASQKGAFRVAQALDNLASLVQHHGASLGLPAKVAADFALRCDMVSDHLDKGFGLRTAGYYNPAQIGEGVPGPLISDANNPFMNGHFTQEKFTQLAEKQMSGALAGNAAAHRADPKLASLIAKEAGKLAYSQLREWAATQAKSAKKSEEAPEDKEAKKSEDAPEDKEEAAKTASLFGLFSDK